jgi:hypothetical protein
MIVVPMGAYYHLDLILDIDADFLEIDNCRRPAGFLVQTRIHHHPSISAEMKDNALTVAGPEERNLDLVIGRTIPAILSH